MPPSASLRVFNLDWPWIDSTLCFALANRLRLMLRRWCGTVGASIAQQRRGLSSCRASLRFGLVGNNDAVCPSSPMPRISTSIGGWTWTIDGGWTWTENYFGKQHRNLIGKQHRRTLGSSMKILRTIIGGRTWTIDGGWTWTENYTEKQQWRRDDGGGGFLKIGNSKQRH